VQRQDERRYHQETLNQYLAHYRTQRPGRRISYTGTFTPMRSLRWPLLVAMVFIAAAVFSIYREQARAKGWCI
jgi:hypothetical protein